MSTHLYLALVCLGIGALLLPIGCVSAEEQQRQALTADFNQWLGQIKQSRIRKVGPPDRCANVQTGSGEVCEWHTDGNALRYRYDASGIARQWTYTDPQLGVLEGAQYRLQGQASEGSVWQSIKEAFSNMQFSPAASGS